MRLGFDLHGAVLGDIRSRFLHYPPFAKFHYHCTSYSIVTISYKKTAQRYGIFLCYNGKTGIYFRREYIFFFI